LFLKSSCNERGGTNWHGTNPCYGQ